MAMGWAETGTGCSQLGASGFVIEAGRATLRCGLFVLKYRCGQRAAGSVLGLGLIISVSIDWSHWLVDMLLSVWRWGGRRWGQI